MGEPIKKITASMRFIFSMAALVGTLWILKTAGLSPGGEVAAFSFLGTVSLAYGASKVAEYVRKP